MAAEIRLAAVPGNANAPFAFQPREVRVKAGQAVRWVNDGDVFHTITSTPSLEQRTPSGLFDAAVSARGQTFEHTFARPGTFAFYCRPHSEFMAGVVTVT